jgi:hypothetical protein
MLVSFPLAASNVGKRYPSEKYTTADRTTGRILTVLTASEYSDAKPYQTHETWTADGEWIVFRSNRGGNGSQLFAVHETTGAIVQLTDAPAVNGGSINLSRKNMKLYYIRGGSVGGTGNYTGGKTELPRQIVELDIGTLLKDAMANAVKAPETYERIVVTLPEELRGSGLALDADETRLYLGIALNRPETPQPSASPPPTPATVQATSPSDSRSSIDSRNTNVAETREEARARFEAAGRGKSGIRAIDVQSGEITKVIDVDLRMGHLQANPWIPGEIIYCHETTGDAVQRIWTVRADGDGNRPVYAETPDEWITHETVSGPDEVMFNIMGHLPYLRKKPTGIAAFNLRTGQMKLLGQVEENLSEGRQGGFWHCNGSPDGRWATGDTFRGSIYLINRRTGKRTLLTAGHPMRPDHTHPIFSPDSRRILIQSGLFSGGKALHLMTVPTGEEDDDVSWPEITRKAKPGTRWWWMGSAVDSANITYNLETLSRAGIGGVEITPIYGVKGRETQYIDYLSPQWMKMLAFTLSEAGRLDMDVDMNNGTGWPFGGPEVSIDDAATKATFRDNRLETGKTGQKVKRAAPGGEGLVVDHLNKDAVKRYFEKFDRAFTKSGTPFPHSFFNDSYEVYGADWTPGLLDEFEQRRGYRLQDYFQELPADGATDVSARVIADYRETVADMLRENFTQVWVDWAHKHGVTTRNQAHGSPANLIDLYALVDIPECESFGITDFDIPLLRKDSIRKTNDSDPTVLKYASSAAHIAGKKYTSAETFTWLTEHFRTSLAQCKPELDLMFASGVNHVFFHGTTYSPKDAPWPGWKFYASIDMSPTNTIWRDAPAFFDYIARTQSFLQSGLPDNDFLLYLPIYDIWHEQRGNYYLPFSIHGMSERLPEFCSAVNQIMASGYDVDYISDRFVQTCTVENGMLKTEGGTLYKALILPAVKRIPVGTLSRIHELAQQGANVIFAGQYPEDVPGLFRLEERRQAFAGIMEKLRMEKTVTMGNFDASLLTRFDKYRESFVADRGGKLLRQKHADGHLYFFAMLQNNPIDDWVTLGTTAESAVFYDPLTGRKGKARVRTHDGKSEVCLQLQPGESIILKTFDSKNVSTGDWIYYQPTGKNVSLNAAWKMRFIESEPAVNEEFNLHTPVSWTELGDETLTKNMGTAIYETKFNFKKEQGKEYRLCLGDVRESAVVRVNGKNAGTLFAVPFETLVGELLQNGENTIEIEVTNLPANRISDYDRRNVEWRIFHEINFVSITYKNTRFDMWEPLPSGLLGPVVIKELEPK